MAMTHQSGPEVTYGQATVGADKNSDAGPNVSFQGDCILDVRPGYNPGMKPAVWSHFDSAYILTVNVAPAALLATNLINAVAVAGAGAVTITAGVGIASAVTIQAPYWNLGSSATQTGLFGIKSSTGDTAGITNWLVPSGTAGAVVGRNNIYDPTTTLSRGLQYKSSNAGDTTQTITVAGYDVYGMAMTETVTLNGTTVVNGKKAFKYVKTITASGVMVGNLSVGTNDIIGINLRADLWEYLNIFYNGAYVTASTGYVAADTATATATTGDTRGTYALQSASDGTKRLAIFFSISPNAMTTTTNSDPTPLYGKTQF